ncbi:SpoIIE family protein phosphatase [Aquicoccus sp. SCR17]|nr:SpoIIE family protein phosphatase [Carideicomes alvinocaridis]
MTQFRTRYSAKTHVGLKRQVNEDAVLSLPETRLWVLSDGMGGHEAGDYASRLICDMVASLDVTLDPGARMQELRHLLTRAHETIRREAEARGAGTIGATVVTLLLADGHFVGLWAGDSRLYRLRDGEIEMLSHDHSLVAELVAAGQLTWDEAEQHPQSNAITRAVGVGEALELDKVHGELQTGDRFLLCSDGLTKYATFAMLRKVLAEAPIETVSETLLQIALDGGGADNISVIVVDIL